MTGWAEADRQCMQQALAQASLALAAGEVPVGAVLYRSGRELARGHNRTLTDKDPTAHAEIVALRGAALALDNHRLVGTELFVTLEPCAMCVGALIQARVRRVVFAAYDERAGAAGSVLDLCAHADLNHRIEVNGGLLAEDAGELLSGFFAARR